MLKGTSFLDLRERELVALLGPLRKIQFAVTPRPLGLSASNFVGLYLPGVSFSTPSSVAITSFAQILLSELSFQNGRPGR